MVAASLLAKKKSYWKMILFKLGVRERVCVEGIWNCIKIIGKPSCLTLFDGNSFHKKINIILLKIVLLCYESGRILV